MRMGLLTMPRKELGAIVPTVGMFFGPPSRPQPMRNPHAKGGLRFAKRQGHIRGTGLIVGAPSSSPGFDPVVASPQLDVN